MIPDPERMVLYRVLFYHFESFLTEYENRFEKEYGFLRPIVKPVVERYLDCGDPHPKTIPVKKGGEEVRILTQKLYQSKM